jgi:hypothetical protein
MKSVEDPFAEAGPGFGKMDKVVAKPDKGPHLDVGNVIRRLAEIEDELSRRGLDPLEKEKAKLRKALKDYMDRLASEVEYDETSGWEAVLVQRFSDTWDVDAFKAVLTPQQRGRYIAETVSTGAVGDGIKNGDLSRGELEAGGAVTKKPGAKALYVRERKETDDAEVA